MIYFNQLRQPKAGPELMNMVEICHTPHIGEIRCHIVIPSKYLYALQAHKRYKTVFVVPEYEQTFTFKKDVTDLFKSETDLVLC